MKKKVSKALLEVWKWKEELADEVKDLDLKDALKERLIKSMSTVNALGLKTTKMKKI